ncbi:MAG: family 43 glycosylhydrolase [Prevotella sp.]|nr:family 43 glycosylhydrolase [Prevotella sp.]
MRNRIITFLLCIAMSAAALAQSFPRCIMAGDYPDPSIMREGRDFYMTHSMFDYNPGFLIWHSQNLVDWEPVCRVATRHISNAWAPDLLKYNGKYYLYFPSEGKNYVCTATNIAGPWTDPVEVTGSRGIDPGHIATPDGQRYLFVNFGRMAPLNAEGTALTDTLRTVHRGWPIPRHWVTERPAPNIILESPKLLYHNGYYYLTSAEGGTAGPATSHMVVSARATSIEGPWEESPYNPIVHTYSATDPWWSKGHGTLIDDADGRWWLVYHAYARGYHSLGRQTLLEPVEWTADGWFRTISTQPLPQAERPIANGMPLSDDFNSQQMGLQWIFFKEYAPQAVTTGQGRLLLQGKGRDMTDSRRLLVTAQDKGYDVQVKLRQGSAREAGLILSYNDTAFSGATLKGRQIVIYHEGRQLSTHANTFGRSVTLRLRNLGQQLTVQASSDGQQWTTLTTGLDLSQMNHNRLRGFIALRPGLAVAGSGKAEFSHFQYSSHAPQEADMAAYLMVYHRDEDHGLHMAISHDGYTFTALKGDQPIFSGDTIAEQHGIRDPHIYRGPDGAFYLAMTDLHVYGQRDGFRTTEWERSGDQYGWGNNRGLVLMKSWDLVNWKRANVDFSRLFTAWSEIGCAWAPETIFDETTGRYMIYLTMRQRKEPNKLYYCYVNEDYNTIETEPQLLFQYPDEHYSAIDGDITKVGDTYHLCYVSHDGSAHIMHATGPTPRGPWQFDARQVSAPRIGHEAPHVFKRIGEQKYVLMYDIYRLNPMNFGFVETSDFQNFQDLGVFNGGVMKYVGADGSPLTSPKHGAVVQITAEEAQTLKALYLND